NFIEDERHSETDRQTGDQRQHPFFEYKPQNVARRRADCDAYTDLLSALVDRMRDDGIHADRSEQKTDRGQDHQKNGIDRMTPVITQSREAVLERERSEPDG